MDTRDLDIFKYMLMASIREVNTPGPEMFSFPIPPCSLSQISAFSVSLEREVNTMGSLLAFLSFEQSLKDRQKRWVLVVVCLLALTCSLTADVGLFDG